MESQKISNLLNKARNLNLLPENGTLSMINQAQIIL